MSSSKKPANVIAIAEQKASNDNGSPMRLGSAAYRPTIVQTKLPSGVSFQGSIHDKTPAVGFHLDEQIAIEKLTSDL